MIHELDAPVFEPLRSRTKRRNAIQPPWLSCDGKDRFSSAKVAAQVAKRITTAKRRRGTLVRPLTSYHCDHCGFFHIGGGKRR
jgi:hypothetical protein